MIFSVAYENQCFGLLKFVMFSIFSAINYCVEEIKLWGLNALKRIGEKTGNIFNRYLILVAVNLLTTT